MRDTARIYDFCNKLAGIWSTKSSDLRFGQLMSNVFDEIKNEGKDPFYLEENEMLKYVEDYLNSIKNKMERSPKLNFKGELQEATSNVAPDIDKNDEPDIDDENIDLE